MPLRQHNWTMDSGYKAEPFLLRMDDPFSASALRSGLPGGAARQGSRACARRADSEQDRLLSPE